MTSATNITKSEAERGGVKFFDYDIESPVSVWVCVDGCLVCV
jgi:hypothetical protein